MLPRILLIDNYDSFTHNLVRLLDATGACTVTVVANDRIADVDAGVWDKALISPGPGLPREAGALMAFLARWAGRRPVLGVCLGHQAIAEHYGGALRRLDRVRHGVTGDIRVTDAAEPLFAGLPARFGGGLYHSWAVDDAGLPDCLAVTARSADGVIMALAHRTLDVRGIQFHPESVMTPLGREIIRRWLGG